MPNDQVSAPAEKTFLKQYFANGGLEAYAAAALAKRRAEGEIMFYVQDGWMVREVPGEGIERLCPVAEFRAADYP